MLEFRPLEKNLFGQVRSWSAASGAGRYVVERSPTEEAFQAHYQPATGKAMPLQGGAPGCRASSAPVRCARAMPRRACGSASSPRAAAAPEAGDEPGHDRLSA